MGLSMEAKKAVVEEVAAEVARAQTIVLAEYRGLEVGSMTELRRKARSSGVYLRVLKNTLARRAVKDTPFEQLAESMSGPLIYGISSDPVASAKVMNEFAKGNEKFVIRAGAMPNALFSAKEVTALAALPARAQLLAIVMGTMQAPIARALRTLNEVPARFARTLAAVCDAKKQAGA